MPFSTQKGKLPWPAKGKLLKRYGESRQGKITWEGLFIGTGAGTPVQAVHHGRVVFADWLRGQGLLVIVDHGAGYHSLYAHLKESQVDVGNEVEEGEEIASVGDTGSLKGPYLYFEIRKQGQAIDPLPWLEASE